MRGYFGWMGLGFGLVALSGAVLAWDGVYLLFKTLDTQQPYVPHYRYIVLPPQTAVLVFSQLTSDLTILQTIFGLMYALVPLGSLALAWWIVRENAPALFVWAVLGISLGTLPGVFPLYVEAVLVVQMFWVVILAILTRMHKKHTPIVILVSGIMILTHPFAIPLFGLAAGTAFLKKLRGWSAIFLLLTGIALIRFLLLKTDYESARLSLEIMRDDFDSALAGLPMIGQLLTCAAALLIVLPVNTIRGRYAAAGFLLITAGMVFFAWSRDYRLWASAFAFRSWSVVWMLPFWGLAVLDLRIHPEEGFYRKWLIYLIGIIFVVVTAAQSLAWRELNHRFQAEPAQACTPIEAINWLGETPLSHWSITAYSLYLGGRAPQKVVLYSEDCAAWQFEKGLPLTYWEFRDWDDGWFMLQPLQAALKRQAAAAD